MGPPPGTDFVGRDGEYGFGEDFPSVLVGGVAALFPGGGQVFPVGLTRRFRLDVRWGRIGDNDDLVGYARNI